jgi:hypothetical protein
VAVAAFDCGLAADAAPLSSVSGVSFLSLAVSFSAFSGIDEDCICV